MTSNLGSAEVKYLPGTSVYTKAGLDGTILSSFKKKNGQTWCVCETSDGVLWFADQEKIYPHKTVPKIVFDQRWGTRWPKK